MRKYTLKAVYMTFLGTSNAFYDVLPIRGTEGSQNAIVVAVKIIFFYSCRMNKLATLKHKAIQLAGLMAAIESEKDKAEKMLNCATKLRYVLESNSEKALNYGNWCGLRGCPICQWRRTFKVRSRALPAINLLTKDNPDIQVLFLTLTIKNCHQDSLRWTIRNILMPGWRSFSRRRQFPALGYLKSLEITRAYNCYYAGEFIGRMGLKRIKRIASLPLFNPSRFKKFPSEEVHPHYHALLFVDWRYGVNYYLKHKDWMKLWRKSAKLDYNPFVDIRRAYSPDEFNNLEKAALEATKYAMSPGDMVDKLAPFALRQLHGLKLINTAGIVRDYLKSEDLDKIIATGRTDREMHFKGVPLNLDWSDSAENYQITKLADLEWEVSD